jgi:hypothetical protein
VIGARQKPAKHVPKAIRLSLERIPRWPIYATATCMLLVAVSAWLPTTSVYAAILDTRLNQIASGEGNIVHKAQAATTIVSNAEKRAIRLDQKTVHKAAVFFIDESEKSPVAWDAALAVMNYNFKALGRRTPIPPPGPDTRIVTLPVGQFLELRPWLLVPPTNFKDFPEDRGLLITYEVHGPDVPVPQGALSQMIEAPGAGGHHGEPGPQFVVINTTAHMVLDGWDMKLLTFVDAHIVYKGGPVIADHLGYVNCDFDIVQTEKGRQFARSILGLVPPPRSD